LDHFNLWLAPWRNDKKQMVHGLTFGAVK